MQIAVNNLVVIILGLSMFISGGYFLSTIVEGSQDAVASLSPSAEERYLESFPSNQEVYVPTRTVEVEEDSAVIPYGVYNRGDTEATYEATLTLLPEGTDQSAYSVASRPATLRGGERQILSVVVTSDSWDQRQTQFLLEVKNEGSVVDGQVVYVET